MVDSQVVVALAGRAQMAEVVGKMTAVGEEEERLPSLEEEAVVVAPCWIAARVEVKMEFAGFTPPRARLDALSSEERGPPAREIRVNPFVCVSYKCAERLVSQGRVATTR